MDMLLKCSPDLLAVYEISHYRFMSYLNDLTDQPDRRKIHDKQGTSFGFA